MAGNVSFPIHLTADGWRENPCVEERFETWSVTVETYGATRLTRWARVWRSDALGSEEREALRKRFGGPPLPPPELPAGPAEGKSTAASTESG
jgi:hypothetical protein